MVDFVCFSKKLIVELDGPQHFEEQAQVHDAHRTFGLRSRGFHVIRFWNHQLDDDLQSAVNAIQAAINEATPSAPPSPLPNPPREGEGAGEIRNRRGPNA